MQETIKTSCALHLIVIDSLMFLGFGLIALAWIIQLVYIIRGDRNVQPLFIGVYIVAVTS